LLVFLALRSTCSRSALIPASRNTICGEREHAPGAKYNFIFGTPFKWIVRLTMANFPAPDGGGRYQTAFATSAERRMCISPQFYKCSRYCQEPNLNRRFESMP